MNDFANKRLCDDGAENCANWLRRRVYRSVPNMPSGVLVTVASHETAVRAFECGDAPQLCLAGGDLTGCL